MAQKEKRSLSAETPPRKSYLNVPKRSRSVVPSTPLKTPMRTPRRTAFTGTVEQEKRYINEKAHRIVECLQSRSHFGSDFLAGGLRTMSTKQFNVIMEYFAHVISGNRCKIVTTDDMLKFLDNIHYPYIITKSCLKTPNVPHAFGTIVELLSWLTDFADGEYFMDFEREINLIDVEKLFPDAEYIKMFKDNIKRNFSLWNNKQVDEFEQSKTKLVDKFIQKRTGFDSKRQIDKETSRLKNDYEELFRKRFVITKEKILLEKQLKVEQLEVAKAQLELTIEENKHIVAKLKEVNAKKAQENMRLQDKVSNLRNSIKQQSITVQEREAFCMEINYKKQLADSLREAIEQLRVEGYPKQVALAQLMKQKVDSASKLNKHLTDIQNLLSVTGVQCKIKNISIVIDATNLSEQIEEIAQFLELLKLEILKLKSDEQTEHLQAKSKLVQVESDLEAQTKQHLQLEKSLAELELNICNARRETATIQMETEKQIKQLQFEIENLLEQNVAKVETLQQLQEQCAAQEKETIEKLALFKQKSKELLNERRTLLEQQKKDHNELKQAIIELKKEFEQ